MDPLEQAIGWLNRTARGEVDGVPADVVSYTIVISGLSRNGRLGDAMRWLDRMVGAGVRPDAMCYNTLVAGYAISVRWGVLYRH